MTWVLALCALGAGIIIGLYFGRRLVDPPGDFELPEAGADLREGDVTRIAEAHMEHPDVLRLAVDWGREHRGRKRDVAMLNVEIDDLRRRLPRDLNGASIAPSEYVDPDELALQAMRVYSEHTGIGMARNPDEDMRAAWLAVVRTVRQGGEA